MSVPPREMTQATPQTISTAQRLYPRFSLTQRLEHVVMLTSFTILAVTGLPQKFASQPWAESAIAWMGGIERIRIWHRYAATALMLMVVVHLVSVAYWMLVQRVRPSMLPSVQDVRDALQAFVYNLGLTRRRPQMGRYTFEEKVEYWSLVWGTMIMILTGFMMWNPIATTRFVPGEFIPAAKAAHGAEAILAVLAILIWHMYSVHLRHFNKSMWTGKLTEEEMLHEHPLELADIKAGVASRPQSPAAVRQRQRAFIPTAVVAAALLLVGIYWFVTFEQTALAVAPAMPTVQVFVPQTPTPLPPTPTPPPVSALTWNGYVSTVLEQKCTVCHGQAAGLSLGSYAAAMKGSRNGPVIVPGRPEDSLLIQKQAAGGHPGQLSADELARFQQWIEAGAPEE